MVNLKQFSTIIFDFGGVIFDIDPDLSKKAFVNLYGENNYTKIVESGLLWEFEKGLINAAELRKTFELQTKIVIDDEIFNHAWNVMLVQYMPERIEKIKELAKTHKLFMLSNTNELHYEYFSNKLNNEYGIKFTDLFQKVYLSYEMGLLKPGLEIFSRVLKEQKLKATETLFIEDTKENTDAAIELGIQTLLIPRNGSFYNYLE